MLDQFSDQEIIAMTLVGESESLGSLGMTQTACTIQNRVKANLHWMGGKNARDVCLAKNQYDAWWPEIGNEDRERIIDIATNNPLYGPYVIALVIAANTIANAIDDITNGAVSYGDHGAKPKVHPGSEPCLVVGSRVFFDLKAVA